MRVIVKQRLLTLLCVGLGVATALTAAGCTAAKPSLSPAVVQTDSAAPEQTDSLAPMVSIPLDGGTLGEGQTEFAFVVVDGAGQETQFQIRTDEATVGAALLKLGLIAGDEGQYGLYVKTVNGITVDYDTDGKYWAFYVDEEYASTGVDSTQVVQGGTYSFKVK